MKFAILFSDNDFYNTFMPVLNNFKLALTEHYSPLSYPELTKAQLARIINEMSFGHYLLYQNPFKYGSLTEAGLDQKKQYLQIDESQILMDEEVDLYILGNEWDNSETFILHMERDEPLLCL